MKMNRWLQDIQDMKWAIDIFMRCVPDEYKIDNSIILAKYSEKHPTKETIEKILTLHDEYIKNENECSEVEYISKNLK